MAYTYFFLSCLLLSVHLPIEASKRSLRAKPVGRWRYRSVEGHFSRKDRTYKRRTVLPEGARLITPILTMSAFASGLSQFAQSGISRQNWQCEIVNPDDLDQDKETKLLNYYIVIGP
ncbi:hypothetical protein TNCV_1440031 [Trichonephila clavipes]|nr:hypothetical protein TNCV_1440031 [Trichonephila clavipes]